MPALHDNPMHLKDGSAVTLSTVLKTIPQNNLRWHILEFTGIGSAPGGMTMLDFRLVVRACQGGYRMSWNELLNFASGLDQVWDCLIVGLQSGIRIERDLFKKGEYLNCDYVIVGFDSTESESRHTF